MRASGSLEDETVWFEMDTFIWNKFEGKGIITTEEKGL